MLAWSAGYQLHCPSQKAIAIKMSSSIFFRVDAMRHGAEDDIYQFRDDGWSLLSRVSDYIHNNSSFSVMNYRFQKLGDLVRASKLFDIEMRGTVMVIRTIRKQGISPSQEAALASPV